MAFEFEQRPLSELPSRVPEEVQEWLDDQSNSFDYDLYVAYGDDEIVTQAVLCVAGDGGCEVTVSQQRSADGRRQGRGGGRSDLRC